MKVALHTGSNDKHYQLGLLSGLVDHDIIVDFIANDDMKDARLYKSTNYINYRGDQDPSAPIYIKILRIMRFYFDLFKYAAMTDAKIFHIQWLNKFVVFERTLLNVYYKMLGKKLVYTAHNINERTRDGGDTLVNRLSLVFMYRIMDHIIVHTDKMKSQLMDEFHINGNKISVIPHGIHDAVIQTDLTRDKAREMLGLKRSKVLLFFGNIVSYKGLEYAVTAVGKLLNKYRDIKLVIAGRALQGDDYWNRIERLIDRAGLQKHIIKRIEFIPDQDIELYYKAADLSVLPYTYVFQSGILFMSYNFGIPVVATDVGSLREDVIEGQTGFICRPNDPSDLSEKIDKYFQSDLYRNLEHNRSRIVAYARDKYSWSRIGEKTYAVYKQVLKGNIDRAVRKETIRNERT